MKKGLIFELLLSIFFGCNQKVDFTNGNISISLDHGGIITLKNTDLELILGKHLYTSVN